MLNAEEILEVEKEMQVLVEGLKFFRVCQGRLAPSLPDQYIEKIMKK